VDLVAVREARAGAPGLAHDRRLHPGGPPASGPLAIGVDVGGTHAKLVLVGDDGAIVRDRRIDTGRGATSATLVPE